MAGVTSSPPSSSAKRKEELAASLKLSYCQKAADELLLGLLDVAQELCFSDLEVFDDEVFQGMDLEKCMHSSSYLELIGINGIIDRGDCWQVDETRSDNSEKECWSMAVNLTDKELGSERGTSSWLESFRDTAIVKVDTGQNLRYCLQVLGSLIGALWDIVRSMFGYKEGFGN